MGEIIKQKFNLYNTVGFIDKDKNIYFVPHQADIYDKVTAQRTKVCDCYFNLFNEVSPFSSKYHDTEISQWSPEDRSLKIEGLIDDFRQSRGRGLALNYLVMTREIYEVEGETETLSSKYYYAFFIDSVEQAGSRSVKLNLSPDYFTNFFYLNNNDILTSTYDPFNPVMKNCFIERQHYDRFGVADNTLRYVNLDKILSSQQSFNYKYQFKKRYDFLPYSQNINVNRYQEIVDLIKDCTTRGTFLTLMGSLNSQERKLVAGIFVSYLNVIFKDSLLFPVNITIPDENAYDYVAGFGKYGDVHSPLTHAVLPFISIPYQFKNISKDYFKQKVNVKYGANQSICELGELGLKEPTEVLDYLSAYGGSLYLLSTFISKYSPLSISIDSIEVEDGTYLTITYLIDLQQENRNVANANLPSNYPVKLKSNSFGLLPQRSSSGLALGNRGYTYATEHARIPTTLFNIGDDTLTLNTQVDGKTVYLSTYSSQSSSYIVGAPVSDMMKYFIFVIGDFELPEQTIKFKDGLDSVNLNSDYIDPLLESDPYTFYSLSINQTEQIISKMRLFKSYYVGEFTFKLLYLLSFNDTYKVGFIPCYNIENYQRYYSESLVVSLSSELPVINDAYLEYRTLNKAQMKNQYAVQENNYRSAMTQATVSGIANTTNQMIGGAVKGAGGGVAGALIGAGVGAVKGSIQMGANLYNVGVQNDCAVANISLTQKAKLADMGAVPDTVKFAGSDVLYDMVQNDIGLHINKYTIDEVSYNSACKYLERFGYLVNIFDTINPFNRIGFNFVQITSFDFVEDDFVLSQEQMEAVSSIFKAGVTLLHNHDYLHNLGEYGYHNYETVFGSVFIPQLSTPTIALSGSTLFIEEVEDGEHYDIYVDGEYKDTIDATED